MLLAALTFAPAQLRSQIRVEKPPITNDTYKTWTSLSQYNISNNGKYAWYEYGTEQPPNNLVVCTTDGKYKREFPRAGNAQFTADSKRLIFSSPEGFAILNLEKDSVQCTKHSEEFAIPRGGDGRWLAYHTDSAINLKDMISSRERSYQKATGSWFNEQGTILLVQTPASLLWVSLQDGKEKIIVHGAQTNNITFNAAGTKIAFITFGPQRNMLRCYQAGMDTAAINITDNSPGIEKGFTIADEAPQFSRDGQNIFFKLAAVDDASARDSTVITDKVTVWNYKDKDLQSQQTEKLPELNARKFYAITAINTGKVIILESDHTTLNWPLNNKPGSKYILASNVANGYESYWNKDNIVSYQLVSLLNGNHKRILPDLHTIFDCQLSPDEQFVTWYDQIKKNYFSYEVATGNIRNITRAVNSPLSVGEDLSNLRKHNAPFGVAGWLSGDNALLIYDRYDIWQVDPMNKKDPVNITGGYGKLHKITFRIIGDDSSPIIADTLLLTALNSNNKYNGFWKKQTGTSAAPALCGNMAPYLYYFPGTEFGRRPPVKAKNTGVYLIKRTSATDAPNLLATTDFHSFISLSDFHPEKKYNWMTAELIHWKRPDGGTSDGLLYKPENFDARKKYPLIFYYYETLSTELFSFKKPALGNGILNIPWYVSNGYLVCVPDIYYITGHTGQSAVNSVLASVKYLSKFSWVDSQKMGLQGHSFGGYETNYLVTHSNIFAAAQESAGVADMISEYGGISYGGQSAAFQSETGQGALQTTPWQRPDIYVENSPIFNMDKVNTPLLMMHNKGDGAVPFTQAMEMFTALRRLQKPVWLLQYDGEGHTLGDPACKLDFTIRQQQFFDHYLKGKPAPLWMTEGIPAKDKGIKSGLALSGQ